MKTRIKLVIVLALTLIAIAAFAATRTLLSGNSPPSVTSGTASIGGPFTLMGSNGGQVTHQSYPGKWLLIFFGYTFCPDVCPTTLNNISVALEKLGPEASKLQPLFITSILSAMHRR
jgi:protein SCO1/2